MWHGSPSGDLRGSFYGLHLGSREAATEALEARIGKPATGVWDGSRKYGETPLIGRASMRSSGYFATGHNCGASEDDYLPRGDASFSSGTKVPLDCYPSVFPVQVIGPMVNSPDRPYTDNKANSLMRRQVSRGAAKSGIYYTNECEDSGSLSAVVPSGSHVRVLGFRTT